MTTTVTPANPSIGAVVTGYDPVTVKTNIAIRLTNVTTDSNANPPVTYGDLAVVSEDQAESATEQGHTYSVNQVASTANNIGLAISSTGTKTVVIKRIRVCSTVAGGTFAQVTSNSGTLTLDNTGAATAGPFNKLVAGSGGSATIAGSSNTTLVGTNTNEKVFLEANAALELLTENDPYVLPSGSTNALAVYISPSASASMSILVIYYEK